MKVLLTGANGKLGLELRRLDWGRDELVPSTRAEAELSDAGQADRLVGRHSPDVVLHAASATDLVRCEGDRQFAWEQVALPALHVARACSRRAIRMVHVSTDYVFSGEEPVHPIPPATRPDPINVYGLCKAESEAAVRALPDHLVVRTTMKPRAPWKHPQAPVDMWISHSYVDEVATHLHQVARSSITGVQHFGVRDVNVFEFARLGRPDVQPVLRADITTLRLPRDVRLAPGVCP